MNRDEYLTALETEPATANQRGAIMREFARLGFHPRRDRARRLAICAALLELDELRSTGELVMGQAGQLVKALQGITDLSGLPAVGAYDHAGRGQDQDHTRGCRGDGGQGDEPGSLTWPAVIQRIMISFYRASQAKIGPADDDGAASR